MGKPADLLFHAERKDFRVETLRGTGPGGQHRNKTESGVRITHLPTGIAVYCCEGRSQLQNKKTAFARLAKLVVAHVMPERVKVRNAAGTVVVRTYHAVDNRVKDHETGQQDTYDAVLADPTAMIEGRREAMA